MWKCEFKAWPPRSKWQELSAAPSEHLSNQHMFGWMMLFTGSWHVIEGDMARMNDLIESLRKRQNAEDARAILDTCELSGVEVTAIDGNLKICGQLTDDLRADLKRCKPELLKLLATVPAWDDLEHRKLMQAVKDAHALVNPLLHPAEDDVFSIAARNILADALAAIARARSCRRIDLYKSRADWVIGWMATLDQRANEFRPDWSIVGRPPHLIGFAGKVTRAMERRREKDDKAKRLAEQRRYAEAYQVENE